MKDFSKKTLYTYIEIADIHAQALQSALFEIDTFFPLTKEKIININKKKELSFFDMVIFRFSLLQYEK